jgi:hypothetical protein
LIAAFSAPNGVIHNWCVRAATKRGPGCVFSAGDVPGVGAADVPVVLLLAGKRIAAAAFRFGAAEGEFLAHRPGFVIDRPDLAVDGDLGPEASRGKRLPERIAGSFGRNSAGSSGCPRPSRWDARFSTASASAASAPVEIDATAIETAAAKSFVA